MSASRTNVHEGSIYHIAFARDRSDTSPAKEFYDGLKVADKAKLWHCFEILCDSPRGKALNPEKFGVLEDGIFEIKSKQIRMPFAYADYENYLILLSHGFIKKKNKTPKEHIERAKRIFKEDALHAKIHVISDAKQRKGK